MKVEQFQTESADYRIYLHLSDPRKPFTIYLHGGPGFNCFGERNVLAPLLTPHLNLLWFDLLGCAESPARSPDKITWDAKIEDIGRIVRKFAGGPVNVIGHCLGTHLTHDLVRQHRDLVGKVVWYSPAGNVTDIFKGVITRALMEGRLDPKTLSEDERDAVIRFNSLPAEDFSEVQTMLLLTLSQKIRGFQEQYWSDPEAMKKYLSFMTERPFAPDVFVRMQTQFFLRGPQPVPSYEGIPVLMLHSDNDTITPWELNGRRLMGRIPHAETALVAGGSHWIHFQEPEPCARRTIEFLSAR